MLSQRSSLTSHSLSLIYSLIIRLQSALHPCAEILLVIGADRVASDEHFFNSVVRTLLVDTPEAAARGRRGGRALVAARARLG